MRTFALTALVLLGFHGSLLAQYPESPNDGGFDRRGDQKANEPAYKEPPVITDVELSGPLIPSDFQSMFDLSDDQMKVYQQVHDSFMVATKDVRDAAEHRVDQLGSAYGRDSAAVDYYKERLKELGKSLREAQIRFDERIKKLLNKDQQKRYKDWRKRQDEAAKQGPPIGSPEDMAKRRRRPAG